MKKAFALALVAGVSLGVEAPAHAALPATPGVAFVNQAAFYSRASGRGGRRRCQRGTRAGDQHPAPAWCRARRRCRHLLPVSPTCSAAAPASVSVPVRAIGDAWAPGTIAAAVWSGRRYAEEFDAELSGNDVVPFRREVTQLHADPV